jgi:plasmid stability protein
MPILQIRDIPESLHRKLRDRAQRDRRSLSQEAVAILEKGLEVTEDAKTRRRRLLQQITERPVETGNAELPDPVQLIREDRSR